MTTAAAIELGGASGVHGYVLTRRSLVSILEQARGPAARDPSGRCAASLQRRAPVIVGGLIVLARDPRALPARRSSTVSERDLLHGAALEAAELPEVEEGAVPPMAFTCC